ncbi:MAG: heparinase II/III family protein, partial [Verrucomicrobiota bacterium]|nr:heparinase II/III family protein [Verrucomicrobiota bacterium]
NTLCISGKEQHLDVGLFQLKDRGSARIVLCEPTRFIGEHSGFGATHRREVTLHNESIEGFDHCSVCPHQISFHFAPGWQGRQIAPNVTEWAYGSLKVLISANQGQMRIIDSEISFGYGVKEPALALILDTQGPQTRWMISFR